MGSQSRKSATLPLLDGLPPVAQAQPIDSSQVQLSYTIDPDALLTRVRLSDELNKRGFPISPKTLATKASRGGGPPYVLFGRRPLYRWRHALSWAEGRLTAPRCSSSEGDATTVSEG
jgi:hypothetical protein